MATSGGPNIVTDGLVFGYDAGYPAADNNKSLRFYNGEPTTNLITNPIPETDTTGFNRSGGTGTISYDSTEKALKWVQTDYASWGTYLNIYPSFTGTLSTSTQYTLSFEYKTLNVFGDNLISHNLVQGNGQSAAASTGAISNNTSGEINGWKQFSVTFTPSNTGVGTAYNRVITGDRGSDTLTMYIKNIQFEQKSHQTPFVNGTRSSTGALIDLKETTNIDVDDISFNSTGQPTFDGTDDYLNLGDSSVWDFGNTGTIEAVLKPTNSTGNDRLWCIDNNSSNLDAYLNSSGYNVYLHGNTVGTTTPLTQNQYNHLVVRYDNGTVQIYINGAAGTMTGTTTGYNIVNNSGNNSNLYLGCYRNLGYNLNGDMPIFRVYGSALSVNEIEQNYNAYKKRFGI